MEKPIYKLPIDAIISIDTGFGDSSTRAVLIDEDGSVTIMKDPCFIHGLEKPCRACAEQPPMRTAYANLNEDGSISIHGIQRDDYELCNHPTRHEDDTVSFCTKPKGHSGKHNPGSGPYAN